MPLVEGHSDNQRCDDAGLEEKRIDQPAVCASLPIVLLAAMLTLGLFLGQAAGPEKGILSTQAHKDLDGPE